MTMLLKMIKPLQELVRYETWKSQWLNQDELSIHSYISSMIHPEDVLIFCKLLFPDFIVYGEGVFLECTFNSDSRNMSLPIPVDRLSSLEKSMNLLYLYEIFAGTDAVSDNMYMQVAEVMALSWRLSLANKFPERNFSVEVKNKEHNYGPSITFFQS